MIHSLKKHAVGLLSEYRGLLVVAGTRVGNIFLGLLLITLVSTKFTAVEQGYFYTFLSLVAAQYFFDLGVGHILANKAGRRLSDPQLRTANNPVASIVRFAIMWSVIASVSMYVIVGSIGFFLFSKEVSADISLVSVWGIYCALGCCSLVFNLFTRLYEGIGLVQLVSIARFILAFLNVSLLYIFVRFDFGLVIINYALAIALFCTFTSFILLSKQVRNSFRGVLENSGTPLHWKSEVWPFQRKVAATWIFAYVVFQCQIPILYYFDGPVAAGRFGMCVQLFQALNSTANIFLTYKIKPWTSFAVNNEHEKLQKGFWRVTLLTICVTAMGVVTILLAYQIAVFYDLAIVDRMLSFGLLALYALAAVLNQIFFSASYYFRAQEKEPVWILTALSALVIVAVPLYLGAAFNEQAAILTFLFISALFLCGGSMAMVLKERSNTSHISET